MFSRNHNGEKDQSNHILSLNNPTTTTAAGTGVFTQVALLSASWFVVLEWASTTANSAAQRRCERMLHALFFQAAQVQ